MARLMRRAGLYGVPGGDGGGALIRGAPVGLGIIWTETSRLQPPTPNGSRYHLHSYGGALVVSLCRARFAFGARGGPVDESLPGPPTGGPRGADDVVTAPCTDPSPTILTVPGGASGHRQYECHGELC